MRMNDPQTVEDRFFAALRAGDADALAELLVDDFLIVDVMSGNVVDRDVFVNAIAAHRLSFEQIEVLERSERRFGDAAIIIGRTKMRGRFEESPFGAMSRYTHVFIRDGERWWLVSAQGTPTVP
jgi:ketosteroid isomerase-like protein